MGARQSKSTSTIELVNNTLTNVLLQSATTCRSYTGVNQIMSFSNIKSVNCDFILDGINQSANLSTNLSCAQDSTQNAEVLNKFATNLDQELKAELSGIPGAIFSNTETNSIINLQNQIVNNINISQVAECVSQAIYNQTLTFDKHEYDCSKKGSVTIRNVSQSIISENVTKCLQTNNQITKAAQEIDNIISNKQSATDTGINPFVAGGISSASSLIPSLLIILFIILSNIGSSEE